MFEEMTVPQGSSGQLTNNHLWQYILDIVLKYNIILMKKVNSETSDWQRKCRFNDEEGLWFSRLISKNEQEPDMSNTASKPKQTKGVFTPFCSLKPWEKSLTSVHRELKSSRILGKNSKQSDEEEFGPQSCDRN